ncbi:MAG: DUF819 family protein [Chlorobi bacterium]|nr:DUF819 family protein [Chlorobiota bacterium]
MIILILFYLFFPAVILFLTHKFSVMNKIGAVLTAYFFGLVIGNSGLMPENDTISTIQKNFSEISVLLALPLLLFSANIRAWLKVAGRTVFSGLLVTVAVIITVISGYFIFVKDIDYGWEIAGLLTGVYTGGTPNMAAIKTALNVSPDIFIITHTYDMLVCTFFLLLAMTVFQRFGLMFLPPFKSNTGENNEKENEKVEELESYDGILNKENRLPLLKSFSLSVLILAAGGGLSMLVPEEYAAVTAILTITTLGILLSLVPSIHNTPKTFHLGMYLILIFSLVVATMGDLTAVTDISEEILFYVFYVVFGTVVLNYIFSAIFRIDADTAIITMTSLIFSPPFVPVVAAKLNNKEIIISGLTVGIIGYAAGNYLGIIIAYALK